MASSHVSPRPLLLPCSDVWVALNTFLYLDFLDATSTMWVPAGEPPPTSAPMLAGQCL